MSPQWDDRLAVGIPVIDALRRRLLIEFAEIGTLLDEGRDWRAIRPRLAGLYGRLQHCFRCEDMLMRLAGDPTYAAHAELHRRLEEEAAMLADALSVKADGVVLCAGWLPLAAQLIRHVCEDDLALCTSLASFDARAA